MDQILAVLFSVGIALMRIGGNVSQFYQAIAHVWVGVLLAIWLCHSNPESRRLAKWLFWSLSVLEVVCFLWFKSHKA